MKTKSAPLAALALDMTVAPSFAASLIEKLKVADIPALVLHATSGLPDACPVTPGMVKIGKSLERAGMGNGASLDSRINVLCSIVVRHAHGATLDDLCRDHTPSTAWLYRTACVDLKMGAGITAQVMRACVANALRAIVAAPVKVAKKAAPVLTMAPATGAATTETTATTEAAPVPYAERMRHQSRARLIAQGERINGEMRAAILAEKEAAFRAEMVRNATGAGRRENLARDLAGLDAGAIVETVAETEQAEAILRALADRLGYKLTAPKSRKAA